MNRFFSFFLFLFTFSTTVRTQELDISHYESVSPLALSFENKLGERSLGLISVSKTIKEARGNLNKKGVLSKVFPGQLVTSVYPLDVIHRLIVLENSGGKDFARGDFSSLYKHVGKHGFGYLSLKVSPANAKGLLQITKGAYDHLSLVYKSAKISGVFDVVVKNPTTSTELAILFVDNVLSSLNVDEREKVFSDRLLFNVYVAAAYNAGGSYALKNLKKGTLLLANKNKETTRYVTNMRTLVANFPDTYM